MFQKRTAGAYGPLRKETPVKIEINGWTFIYTSPESYSSRLTSKDELKNLFSSLLLGLMYVVLIRLVIYVNKLFVHSKFVYMFLLLLTFAFPLLVFPGWNFAKPFRRFLHISVPHTTLQVPSCSLVYSDFEKGCRMKCTRQTRKVLWVVLSSLFFKEIWINGTRGHRRIFVNAKEKQQ